MPSFTPHTPEFLVARSDSKNPAATCRGLTLNGRPCRRALSKLPQSSPRQTPRVLSPNDFCWQHQDQAGIATPSSSPQHLPPTILERTSIDTLVDRLGLLEVEQNKHRRKQMASQEYERKHRINQSDRHSAKQKQNLRSKPKPDVGLFCCMGTAEVGTPPRPAKPIGRRATAPMPANAKLSPNPVYKRPSIIRDPPSRTKEFLSLIPPATSPETTALLLAELAKPISEHDDEGYIYMFWLTPQTLPSTPPSEIASALLAPPSQKSGQQRTSDVLNNFSSKLSDTNTKVILLKIGRAQNVQRRLNQWTRQCGYNLSLIRYYPYQSSTMSSSSVNEPPKTPRKIPSAHKVERLIHIELDGKRALGSGKCRMCGREHREWFEAEATRDGVKLIDEIIRKWVDWGEREAAR
jgi:hypothetical protein